jgi:hypothetical protein
MGAVLHPDGDQRDPLTHTRIMTKLRTSPQPLEEPCFWEPGPYEEGSM